MKTQIMYSESFNNASGSSRQGEITASYNDLVEMFGKPEEFTSGDDKTTFFFVVDYEIEDDFGTESSFFTLYDWKGNRPYDDSEEFMVHVGGFKKQDFWAAQRALEIFTKTDTRYAHDDRVMCQGYSHDY